MFPWFWLSECRLCLNLSKKIIERNAGVQYRKYSTVSCFGSRVSFSKKLDDLYTILQYKTVVVCV